MLSKTSVKFGRSTFAGVAVALFLPSQIIHRLWSKRTTLLHRPCMMQYQIVLALIFNKPMNRYTSLREL